MAIAFTRTDRTDSLASDAVAGEASTDEVLLRRIASGDKLAMRTLFARHQVRTYRFALRIVRDEMLAEDVVSDVFFDVWRQARHYEGRATVSTWLLAITRYKSLSVLRRRTEVELDDVMADSIADPADDPEVAFQEKKKGEILRQCLAGLSPEHGQIIDLIYYHGKSIREVSAIVGSPEATVKTRMFYARKRLAELVQAA